MPKEKDYLPEDWDPRDALKARGIFEDLKAIAPSIAFRVEWAFDREYRWDGDGPDPAKEGYVPHDVNVYASAIVKGKLIEERESLGGVYDKPGERDPDVHGYLPQMLVGALDGLERDLSGPVKKEGAAAKAYLIRAMRLIYETQRRDIERGRYGS